MKKYNRKSFIIRILRNASYKWPPRSEALKQARVERGFYRCNMCKDTFERKNVQLDHIIPVINPKDGFIDWNNYIERMFPEVDGWQVVCTACHDAKTEIENKLRGKSRKKKK